jgi:ABC-type lipoprotein release transport system permease subunit
MVIKMQKENIYTYWHSWIYIELSYYKSNKMVRQVILYILYLVLLQFQIP